MRILIVLLSIAILTLSGCANTKCLCPNKDVIFYVLTPMGYMPIGIEKDFFNKEREGKDWMDLETYNELMGGEEPSEEDNETQPI